MNTRNNASRYQELKGIVNVNRILQKKIEPDMVRRYANILKLLQTYLCIYVKSQSTFKQMIRLIIRIIKQENKGLSVNFVLKKLIFLQFLIKWGCEKQLLGQQIAQIIQSQINLTIRQDLQRLSGQQSKKRSSLDKIGTFLRSFSLSKQNNLSKMKIQKQDSKQIVKQIVTKILEPYCFYLLKVLNDHETYRIIFNKQQITNSITFMWKLINWNRILSKIIYNLYKIGRYFVQDLIGFWVACSYVISQDESIYYSILKENIQSQSSKWLQKLKSVKKNCLIYKNSHSSGNFEYFTDEQLQQIRNLKRQIDQMCKIKEQINFLYANALFKEWKSCFKAITISIQVLNQSKQSYSDQFLDMVQDLTKYKEFSLLLNGKTPNQTIQVTKRENIVSLQKISMTINGEIDSNRQTKAIQERLNQIEPQMKHLHRRNNVFTQKRNRILGRI